MVTCISHSPADTQALGQRWGETAPNGWVVGLCGDLGAGKTQLVKGLALGLGISARVHSPSFALMNIYGGGRMTLFHLDLYRLGSLEQLLAAGLEDYLKPKGVTVIEWAERLCQVQNPEPNIQSPEPAPSEITRLSVHTPPSIHHPSSSTSRLRWVWIEVLAESQRRISYDDFGA